MFLKFKVITSFLKSYYNLQILLTNSCVDVDVIQFQQ